MNSSRRTSARSNSFLSKSLSRAASLLRKLNPASSLNRRDALKQLFESVEGGSLIVKVPDFKGTFEIDGKSSLLRRILIDGEYEPEVVKLLSREVDPNRDAIDVGANIGLFSVLLSALVEPNRVLAVEPTPGALQHLYRNSIINERPNIVVFEGIAGTHPGTTQMNVIEGMEEFSSMAPLVHPGVANRPSKRLSVQVETLDSLVERFDLKPGFIKIDTEGGEYQVLSGATRTMLQHRPVILCEAWPDDWLRNSGGTPGAVAKLLTDHGYVVSSPIEEELLARPVR
jgi:FkbM family methyltransferase